MTFLVSSNSNPCLNIIFTLRTLKAFVECKFMSKKPIAYSAQGGIFKNGE